MIKIEKVIKQFDKNFVKKRFKRINNRPLAETGGLLRKDAIKSVKTRKKFNQKGEPTKASKPGGPPFSKSSRRQMKLIEFYVNKSQSNVIAGFRGLTRKPVPETHEKGGVRMVIVQQANLRAKKSRRKATSDAQRRTARRKFLSGELARRDDTKRGQQAKVTRQLAKFPKRPTMSTSLRRLIASGAIAKNWRGALEKVN